MLYRYTTIKNLTNIVEEGYTVNICNDTVITCKEENETIIMFNSTAIYRNKNGGCKRITGQFFNNHTYLKKVEKKNDTFTYVSKGDICKTDGNKVINYTTTYLIKNVTLGKESVGFMDLPVPDIHMKNICDITLEINANFESITDQLLVQKFFSDYYIATGIIFVILGGYLSFFAKYKKITKFVIGIICGELFVFTLFVGIIGIHYIHMEWAFLVAGLAVGGFLGYFCLGGSRLFRVVLALTSGYIFGLIVFDIIYAHLCTRLSQILLLDTIIIFMSLFVLVICLQHSFHYFYDSVTGGYLLVRGFCLLIKDAGKYARYRELNLYMYLIGKNEIEAARYYYEESWPIYYVYTIIMILIIGGSITYYALKLYKRDEDDIKEGDEKMQKQLMGERVTSFDDDKELD